MNRNGKESFDVIGLMSGTSLDGVDLAFCRFTSESGRWHFEILAAETVPYSKEWKDKLASLMTASAKTLARVNAAYGHYLGKQVKAFIEKIRMSPQLVASHGYTVFHRPDLGYTFQTGDGASLSAECGVPVICDFRTSDVAYGGQGAPLVPGGEALLFPDYENCLNLGGFANLSQRKDGKYIAFDVCPCNIVLNYLAGKLGKEFDDNGDLSRSGTLIPQLLKLLNDLPYYSLQPPKSLGREWVEKEVFPLLHSANSAQDMLRTFTEHIAVQIASSISGSKPLLVTGGGAHNHFLTERIRALTSGNIIIPDPLIIDYKEALIFAFLGLLRFLEMPNCLASVTGASKNATGGAIYLP